MKYLKCIRLWGVAAFVVAVVVLAGGWFIFVDGAVRCMIESTGTRLVGARVELDKADLTLFPAGLVLSGLKVTNPDEPMRNAFEAGRIAFSMDGPNLLRRKIIVEEMEVSGVRLNTRRKTSGAVSGRKKPDTKAEGFLAKKLRALPSFKVPDVNEILKSEKLASLERIESLKAELEREKGAWRTKLDALPDKEKMEGYRKRFEKIRPAGGGDIGAMLGGATELVTLQKDLKKDLDALKAAGGELDNVMKSFRVRVNEVSMAPQEDLNRILTKYSVSPDGLANVSRLLLGPRAGEWTSMALRWHERLKPLIERAGKRTAAEGGDVVRPVRGRGEYVRFKEKHPLPDLLIRKSRVSIDVPAGFIKGEILNLTPDQFVLGKPLTFAFSGEDLKGLESLKLTGALDYTKPESPENIVRFNVKGYKLKDYDLARIEDMSLKIDSSLADLSADVSLKGRSVRAGIKAGLGSLRMSSTGAGGAEGAGGRGAVAKAFAGALSGVRALNIKADITGTVDDYDVKVASDLDKILGGAVQGLIKEQTVSLRKGLEKEILRATNGPLDALNGELKGMEGFREELDRLLSEGGGLLKGGGGGTGGKGGLPGGIKLPF